MHDAISLNQNNVKVVFTFGREYYEIRRWSQHHSAVQAVTIHFQKSWHQVCPISICLRYCPIVRHESKATQPSALKMNFVNDKRRTDPICYKILIYAQTIKNPTNFSQL